MVMLRDYETGRAGLRPERERPLSTVPPEPAWPRSPRGCTLAVRTAARNGRRLPDAARQATIGCSTQVVAEARAQAEMVGEPILRLRLATRERTLQPGQADIEMRRGGAGIPEPALGGSATGPAVTSP